tara:strand:- start:13284 stop:13772 length:489 start_codon:yes stop_codon:yes gene_type:complete
MHKKDIILKKYIRIFTSWRFYFFAIWKLPMVFITRIRVAKLTHKESVVTVPYNYLNKNPFRSTYFAVQAMGAELSTGVLVLMHVDGYNISTLVTKLNSKYFKKATTKVNFICLDGEKIIQHVQRAIDSGEGVIFDLKSKGYDLDGLCVSEFDITWSLKLRKR